MFFVFSNYYEFYYDRYVTHLSPDIFNYHLQLLLKTSHLHPDERDAGEEEVFVNGQPRGYAPLYPLPIIIALSFQLDSMEAYLFRKYICREIHRPTNIITPIFLISKTDS